MPVRVYSPKELELKLDRLHNVLSSLPETLPYSNQFYFFENFVPDPETVEKIGTMEGAVNNALEVTFSGPKGRIDGITFKERGPGLVAVVDVLRTYTTDFPEDVVLQKWIDDLTEAGMKAGGSVVSLDTIMPELREEGPETMVVTGEKRKNPAGHDEIDQPKKQRIAFSATNSKFVQLDWETVDSMKGKGGRKRDPLNASVVVPGYWSEDSTKTIIYRCIGEGCGKTYENGSGYRERFLTHVSTCNYLPSELKERVDDTLGKHSLGNKVSSSSSPTTTNSFVPDKPTNAIARTLTEWAKSRGRAEYNDKVNLAIVHLLCCRALPPYVIDTKQWRNFLQASSLGQYKPVGRRMFSDSLIPREASRINTEQLNFLRTCKNLTISFDGGTTAGQQSVYTVHVTTPDRFSYLIEGNEASAESHTGEHLFQVLKKVIESIGPKRFRAITSNNTGNTSVAREKVREAYPWILILPDPCHRLNLLCKDIAKHAYFHSVVRDLQKVIKFFSHSTKATARLAEKREELGISRGLEKIGKTRFGTLFISALSLLRNFRAISQLVQIGRIVVKDSNHLFLGARPSVEFELGLKELVTALAPVAKAIKCLESSHSTVADVYYFWLAVAADTNRMLIEDELPNHIQQTIRYEVNRRFDQMVNKAPSDVYLTGFILDPRFRAADIMTDLNPLSIQKIKIPARDATGKILTDNSSSSEPPLPETLRRIGSFLLGMLCEQYKSLKTPIAGLSAQDANRILRQQIPKYIKCVYPFDQPFHGDDIARDWWKRLDLDRSNDAQPLAKLARCIFEVLPNSMVDERAGSTMKWFNSRLRNRQCVSTIIKMVKIRKFCENAENVLTPFHPAPRWRDMRETVFGTIRSDPKRTISEQFGKENDTEVPTKDQGIDPAMEEEDIYIDERSSDDEESFIDDETSDEEAASAGESSADRITIADTINITSPVLLDLLAEEERAPAGLKGMEKGKGKQVVGEVKEPDMALGNEDLWKM